MIITETNNLIVLKMDLPRARKHISYFEKLIIVNMWLSGRSCNAISKSTGRSSTAVCRWINRWKLEGHINRRSCSGRPSTKHTPFVTQGNMAHYALCGETPSQSHFRGFQYY